MKVTIHAGDVAIHGKDIADVAAGATAFATLLGYLPAIAAGFTIIWTAIRIWEWYKGRGTSE